MLSFFYLACSSIETETYTEKEQYPEPLNSDTEEPVNDTGNSEIIDEPEDVVDPSVPDTGEEELEVNTCDPEVSGIGLPLVSSPTFTVTVQEGLPYLTDLVDQDILFFPDGALSFLNSGDLWEVFLPVGNKTMTLSGDSPESLTLHIGLDPES